MSQSTLRALMRTDTPPKDAEQIFDAVYLAYDRWHIVPATEELVFAEESVDIWRKLLLAQQYRAHLAPQRLH